MSELSEKFILTLDGRVDGLSERISKVEAGVEARSRTSLRQLIAEFGGYAALVISIITGSYTLYSNFVLQPAKEKMQAEVMFRNNINALSNLGAQVARAFAEGPQAGFTERAAATPQRLALLAEIEHADKRLPHVMKFADRMLLASEYEGFGKPHDALRQIELAEGVAVDGFQKANATWARARLNSIIGEVGTMRSTFEGAVNEFKSLGLSNTAADLMRMYIQWTSIEIMKGECEWARNVHSLMAHDIQLPEVLPNTRNFTQEEFSFMLRQMPRTCGLDAGVGGGELLRQTGATNEN